VAKVNEAINDQERKSKKKGIKLNILREKRFKMIFAEIQ